MNTEKTGIVGKAWDIQQRIEARQQRFGKGKYGRVFKMARKPTNEEYEKTAKITGLGILLIGLVGFIIYIIRQVVVPLILGMFGR
ncbi:MAG: protein translocase SEC61 complex subunit gamma [Methanobacteriota archaeon]